MKTKPRKIPNETYYEDVDWKDARLTELTEQYPNQWIAVVNGQVIAAGRSLTRVKREASKKTGKEERQISVFYIVGDDVIYVLN